MTPWKEVTGVLKSDSVDSVGTLEYDLYEYLVNKR